MSYITYLISFISIKLQIEFFTKAGQCQKNICITQGTNPLPFEHAAFQAHPPITVLLLHPQAVRSKMSMLQHCT